MKKLLGRRILITGAGSGIGLETTKHFIEEGAKVAALDVDMSALKQLTDLVGSIIEIKADVTDEVAVDKAICMAGNIMGGIDGVVNAAGISELAQIKNCSFTSWKRILSTNLDGPFLVCRASIPWLLRAATGTIVNISSASALQPFLGGAAYGASKAGLLNFTRVLAKELAPMIRANTICPGLVATSLTDALERQLLGDPEISVPTDNLYALKRKATPNEIAAAILFLTSNESSFVTGSTLVVDGGRTFY